MAHAAVAPKPDAERGALVKAFVMLAPGHAGDATLVAELQAHVRGKLAPYEYPKEIEFTDALPMTTTGKARVVQPRFASSPPNAASAGPAMRQIRQSGITVAPMRS